ncbi:sensor domain-containing protein [Hydrocarboniclastica marina]|uniref:Diguanylate cyclase n=1 Tax=Hydrocarboniclastica marina TaxID=2259620 RepID=A0A4P7XI86_9ALTE|nr:diguanylate cyclase [Hydrocarboniclastica marina]QCF25992.1 diguanylate cyclase [Hydrocarboniclastica marina]
MQNVTGDDRLYRLFFETSSDAFFVMPTSESGEAQPFIEVNRRACEMLGYSYAQLKALTLRDIDQEISSAGWRRARQQVRREGHDRFYRKHTRRDGSKVPVEVSVQMFHHNEHRYILAVARDISDRLAAEETLKNSRQDLEALVDTGLGFSALVSPDTTILRINSVGARRLGSTPEKLRGKRIIDMSPSDIAERRQQVAREVVRQRRSLTLVDNRDGMWLENTISPIIDETDSVTRFAIFSEDVTVSYLTRRFNTLFNRLDREVLDGVPMGELIGYACEFLVESFASPLICFTESVGTPVEKRVCRGAWCNDSDSPQIHPHLLERVLSEPDSVVHVFHATDHPGLRLIPTVDHAEAAAICVLNVELPMGHRAILAVASLYERMFEHAEILALLDHAASRFRVAFGLVADRRELSLVRQALEKAHGAVMITDGNAKVLWTNEAFSRQSGYALGEIEYAWRLTTSAVRSQETAADHVDQLPSEPFQHVIDTGLAWSGEADIRRRDGSTYTVLQSITPVFSADGSSLLNLIAIQEDISRRKRDEAHIRYLAEHDSLTGLHNREYLHQVLHELLLDRRRPASDIALLYLDIDHFKQVNDRYGHSVGDALLKGFSQRLRAVVREGDLVCRIGGDEFVLLLKAIQRPAEAEAVGLKLLSNLKAPIDCDGVKLRAQSSIGVSMAATDGATPDSLLRNADAAMYESKRQGRGRLCLYSGGCIEGSPDKRAGDTSDE